MTNLVATLTATIIAVTTTNWSLVAQLKFLDGRTHNVLEGRLETNYYAVVQFRGTNAAAWIARNDGPALKGKRLLALVPKPANLLPPPLPTTTELTNAGTLLIEPVDNPAPKP